jgi:hypothetical protein
MFRESNSGPEYKTIPNPTNEEDSPTLNLPIWPLDGALDKGRRFGGLRWRQGKTSWNLGENHSF